MFSLIMKFFARSTAAEFKQDSDSIEKLATLNAINRRKNTRVKYPSIGAVGGLPLVFFENEEMRVGDISTGGLCLHDDRMLMGDIAGQKVELLMKWPDYSVLINCTVVGCNMERRHIQFQEIDTKTFIKLNLLLKPGFIGSKFHRIPPSENIMADEIWVGPTGESVTFFSESQNDRPQAEIIYKGQKIHILEETPPLYAESKGGVKKGQRIQKQLLSDILVSLANFKKPTDNIDRLIKALQHHLKDGEGYGDV